MNVIKVTARGIRIRKKFDELLTAIIGLVGELVFLGHHSSIEKLRLNAVDYYT